MLPRGGPRSYYVALALAACALTSLGINSITQREQHTQLRLRLTTQRTVLRDLIARYRAGEHVPQNEEHRLLRLAQISLTPGHPATDAHKPTSVMQAVFGRPVPAEDEARELAKLREIWDQALRDDEQQQQKRALA
ncbi:hypothetical protein CALCODRAFT_480129 [Calocera cornea HHB12733]|uniref:Uncharacterized protein n=1 Tax=Calocera cornea HHB12733 TaxID=1353952 RepID=A0A165IZR1_9BASI|nr:hypothetical protein CALCODRAFT_480129 [Calocera cornea HHB12733]